MTLIVWSRTEFTTQIVRIQRSVRERDLIVLSVIECLGTRGRRAESELIGKAFLDAEQETVVIGLHARFKIDDPVRSTDDRVKDHTDVSADHKMRPEVVKVV